MKGEKLGKRDRIVKILYTMLKTSSRLCMVIILFEVNFELLSKVPHEQLDNTKVPCTNP